MNKDERVKLRPMTFFPPFIILAAFVVLSIIARKPSLD